LEINARFPVKSVRIVNIGEETAEQALTK